VNSIYICVFIILFVGCMFKMVLWLIVKGVIAGVFSGVITALTGYLKSSATEDFDPKKMLQTLVVGGFVGGVAGFYGVSFEQAYEYLSSVGAITLVEYVKKAILRRLHLNL